jgi:hypothetical protein
MYQSLNRAGNSHHSLERLSVSKAMIKWLRTPEAVDAHFGAGAYQGVKDRVGEYAHWRKLWRRVIEKHRAMSPVRYAALKALRAQVMACQKLGITDAEIVGDVRFFMSPGMWRFAS